MFYVIRKCKGILGQFVMLGNLPENIAINSDIPKFKEITDFTFSTRESLYTLDLIPPFKYVEKVPPIAGRLWSSSKNNMQPAAAAFVS